MVKKEFVSLILPCRNEAKSLRVFLKNIPKFIDEVIVVDNLSKDKTAAVARKNNARIVTDQRQEDGIGYGYALETGIRQARGDIIVCMDGDGSYPVAEVEDIVNFSKRMKADFVSCSRLPIRNPKKMSPVRELGINIINVFVRFLFAFPIKDSLTGMWVFKKAIVPKLDLCEGGWDFSLEIKVNAILNPDIKFMEYDIPYHDRITDDSKQNLLKTGFNHLFYLIKKRVFLDRVNLATSSVPI